MAHTYNLNSSLVSSTGNPIRITSYSTSPGVTVLILFIKTRGSTNRAGGAPTVNGTPMTQANTTQKAATAPECSAELWYLTNFSSGSYLYIIIPNTNGATIYYQFANAKAAPGMRTEFFMAIGANATGTNPSPGSTLSVPTGGIAFAIVANGATTWAPSAQTGTAITNSDDGADGTGTQYRLDAGQLQWTFATSEDYGAVAASFQEVPGIALNNYNCCVRAGDNISVGERIR